ncbi:Short-chain dehydrogenase/reductase SDR [Nitrospira japonica]|uniref:Short-chain dehydrogenase/reductase SDR n=1 Tax=Nitrospira japonica TaxID=1325564 RepID=A0A1W1I2V1_9BACT|nr:SDR family oxidoreductase [Nitrospira japonica]SLM47322.1 Short-chain dehydrogenase/reductase SDR [Nitrospira japonica]
MTGNHRSEVVVVTGASAGVGRAIARRFGAQGASVVLLARGLDGLEGARADVEQAGGRALVIPTDVSDDRQVEAAAEQAERTFGPIDVWINNAMVSVLSPALDMTSGEYRRVTDVTYLGYVFGTLAALRRMVPRDRGVVIQIGSALAYRAIPLQSAYCAAKHAIQGFTESLRSELLHEGSRVRLTAVQLPAVNTPQFSWIRTRMPRHPRPVPPIYQPEVIAEAIYWVSHHHRREFAIGYPTVQAIVGDKFIPGLLDHYLAHVGYESQQTDVPVDPDRRDNLYEPLPGDYGARGRFSEQACDYSAQVWANRHRGWLAAGGVGLLAWWWSRRYGSRRRQAQGRSAARLRRPVKPVWAL